MWPVNRPGLDAVSATVYHGDAAAVKAVLGKSWTYMQRAHLHAGGLGSAAMGVTLLVVMLGVSTMWTRLISLGLGAGAFGYSLFWLWAGFREFNVQHWWVTPFPRTD